MVTAVRGTSASATERADSMVTAERRCSDASAYIQMLTNSCEMIKVMMIMNTARGGLFG
jgi:hypothetical protein